MPASSLYPLARSLLFRLDPETAHELTLTTLQRLADSRWQGLLTQTLPGSPCELFGLRFANRVGLAAGLDKDGECIDGLGALGFGFLELGTVTPKPQAGNPRPRLFRLPREQALINRMGFNNGGVDALVERVRQRRYQGIIGINIGKNKDTPNQQALADYRIGLQAAWPVADYLTVNISSPNTPGLRALQAVESLRPLLEGLRSAADQAELQHQRQVPILLKIAPDLDIEEIDAMAEIIPDFCQGIIATNTTATRPGLDHTPKAEEAGGLSGAPLIEQSTAVLARFRDRLPAGFPLIAAGGILKAEDALRKIDAGADLVQVYTGLIYRGPALLQEIAQALQSKLRGRDNPANAVGLQAKAPSAP